MATRNDEREHLDSERVGIIEEALVKLYQRVKDREIQLSDLTEVLVKDCGERGKEGKGVGSLLLTVKPLG